MITKPPSLPVTTRLTAVVFVCALVVGLMYPRLSAKARRATFAEKALNSTEVGYWILNTEGKFTEVNEAYCAMVGRTRAEILSMCIADFEKTATQPNITAQIQRIHRRGIEQFETQHRKSDGEWIDIEVTATRADEHHVVVLLRDISDRKLAAQQINHLAYYDPLTSLPNRRLLHDRIEQAQRIQAEVCHADTVARVAGNEFAVVLENLSVDATQAAIEAEIAASHILTSVARPYRLGTSDQHLSSSVGITVFQDHSHTVDDLLCQVDLASVKSHDRGHDCMNFYDSAMQEAVESQAGMLADLRREKDQLQSKWWD